MLYIIEMMDLHSEELLAYLEDRGWILIPGFEKRFYINLAGEILSLRKSRHFKTSGKYNICYKKEAYRDYEYNRYIYLKNITTDLATRFEIDKFLENHLSQKVSKMV